MVEISLYSSQVQKYPQWPWEQRQVSRKAQERGSICHVSDTASSKQRGVRLELSDSVESGSRGKFSILPSLMLFSSALGQTNTLPDNTRLTSPLLPSMSQTRKAVISKEFPHPLFFCSTQVAFTLYFVFVHYFCIHYPHNESVNLGEIGTRSQIRGFLEIMQNIPNVDIPLL